LFVYLFNKKHFVHDKNITLMFTGHVRVVLVYNYPLEKI